MLVKAVAHHTTASFIRVVGSEFVQKYLGEGPRMVRDVFRLARENAPAIIFIDELDAIGGKRSTRDHQYMKQTLNQLLVEMDGFMQTEGVIVIAATNFPESLDQYVLCFWSTVCILIAYFRALVRPGRFDRIIAVPLPDVRGNPP